MAGGGGGGGGVGGCQGLGGASRPRSPRPPQLGSPGTLPQLGPCSPSTAAVRPGRARGVETWCGARSQARAGRSTNKPHAERGSRRRRLAHAETQRATLLQRVATARLGEALGTETREGGIVGTSFRGVTRRGESSCAELLLLLSGILGGNLQLSTGGCASPADPSRGAASGTEMVCVLVPTRRSRLRKSRAEVVTCTVDKTPNRSTSCCLCLCMMWWRWQPSAWASLRCRRRHSLGQESH